MAENDPLRQALVAAAPAVDTDGALAAVRRKDRGIQRRRRLVAVAAAAVVVVAVGSGVLASRTTDPSSERTPVTEETTIDDPTVPPTFSMTEARSARRPVQVEPRRDLREGQRVTVTGQGFPPGRLLSVTTCLPVALEGAGTAACEVIQVTRVHARDDGTFEVEHPVQRLLTVGGVVPALDCALVEGGCIVAVGDAFDLVESGGVPVSFDPSVPVPEPPEVIVTPNTDLHDGDEVEVTVTGLEPRSYVNANVCATDEEGTTGCELVPRGARIPRADRSGSLSFSFVAHRRLEPLGSALPQDCGEARCELVVFDNRYRTVVALAFDVDEPAPPLPTVDLDIPDPLEPGDRVEVRAEHFRPEQDVMVHLCPSEATAVGGCSAGTEVPDLDREFLTGQQLGHVRADEAGAARLVVRVPGTMSERSTLDCTRRPGRCDLVVTNFYAEIERVPLTFA